MKHQIKHKFTEAVLFECEVPDDINPNVATLYTIEKATAARANLTEANLAGAYLAGAYLAVAKLAGAKLDGAYLARANLKGAYLDGSLLIGDRPIIQIGPIGSRCSYLVGYLTNQGVKIKAGCFFGSLNEFITKVQEEHGENVHGQEYMAAVEFIKAHAELWGK